jgi:RNA-binding proteins (RRM domain)
MCAVFASRYVGNLDASVSEDLVCALFSQIGPVKGCKIIREVRVLYAFIASF